MKEQTESVKHTPGPWCFSHANDGLVAFRIAGDGFIVADALFKHTVEHTPGIDTARANAVLIAAAPDLLAACKAIQEAASANSYEDNLGNLSALLSGIFDTARAAIAKAEGAQ